MADVAVIDRSVAAAPKDYLLPAGQEIRLRAVKATVDGSGAASAFYPTLQLIAPDGTVMWSSETDTSVAAAGSADVSWFPGVKKAAGASSSLSVTDGTTTVSSVSEIDFTSGATVSSGGAGIADVAVSGGGGLTSSTQAGSYDTGTYDTSVPAGGSSVLYWGELNTGDALLSGIPTQTPRIITAGLYWIGVSYQGGSIAAGYTIGGELHTSASRAVGVWDEVTAGTGHTNPTGFVSLSQWLPANTIIEFTAYNFDTAARYINMRIGWVVQLAT